MSDNLIPMDKRPLEEQRELQLNGGYKSGQVVRARKNIVEMGKLIDTMPATSKDSELVALLMECGFEAKDINQQLLTEMALLKERNKGNVNAIKLHFDRLGEMPAQKQEFSGSVDIGVGQALSATDSLQKLFGKKDK